MALAFAAVLYIVYFRKTKEGLVGSDVSSRLFSIVEAAAYCGVSENLFRAVVLKSVSPVKIGSRVLVDLRALDVWLDTLSGMTPNSTKKIDWSEKLDEDD